MMYTREEQEKMIRVMKEISTRFYCDAAATGNFQFVQFTGLINEFVKICEETMKAGIDFNECTGAFGRELVIQPYNIEYIREKLLRIYGENIC